MLPCQDRAFPTWRKVCRERRPLCDDEKLLRHRQLMDEVSSYTKRKAIHLCLDMESLWVWSMSVAAVNVSYTESNNLKQESRAVARKPRDAAAVLFGLKFADNIHYKINNSQASKAVLQSSKHIGTNQNLTQNGDSRSFKVTCVGVSGKAIRH